MISFTDDKEPDNEGEYTSSKVSRETSLYVHVQLSKRALTMFMYMVKASTSTFRGAYVFRIEDVNGHSWAFEIINRPVVIRAGSGMLDHIPVFKPKQTNEHLSRSFCTS